MPESHWYLKTINAIEALMSNPVARKYMSKTGLDSLHEEREYMIVKWKETIKKEQNDG